MESPWRYNSTPPYVCITYYLDTTQLYVVPNFTFQKSGYNGLEMKQRITSGNFRTAVSETGPPLWSSGQSFWLQRQRSRVRFPALPDFLSSSGSGTGSTQPREVN